MQKETKNKGDVNTSSLIDLKAELFRKQEEFRNQKLQNQNASYIKGKPSGASNKKPSIFSKKNTGVAKRAEKDFEEKKEEEDIFERSKKALESKARLYEKITGGKEVPDEDGSDLYLVDFQKKVIDDVMEKREKERQEKEDREKKEAEEDSKMLNFPVPEAENAEEEWVDYVDSLGRSRRCLRKDLAELQDADRKLHGTKQSKSEDTPGLLSDDMRREMARKQWEKEETEKMEKEKEGPIHYADVQHNEIRTHGVGFYQFDKEERVREEQLEQLKKLRDETKDERSKRERIKEKRKAAMAARLAKVKQRKREKLGLTGEEEEENASSDEMIGPQPAEESKEVRETEPLTRDDSWRKTTELTREWDRGKQKVTERSEGLWLEKQRAEREPEFAPPSFYYAQMAQKTQSIKHKQTQAEPKPSKTADVDLAQSSDTSYKDTEKVISEQKSSKILADVILNQLRGIRSDTASMVEAGSDTTEMYIANQQPPQYASMPYTAHSPFCQMHSGDPVNVQTPDINYHIPPQVSLSSENSISPSVTCPSTSAMPPAFGTLPHNMNVPPPNVNVPPPSLNIQAPNLTVPPPNLNVPPPTLNDPPSNYMYNVPVPNVNFPPPNATNPALSDLVMDQSQSAHTAQNYQGHYQSEAGASTEQASGKPRTIISKMDIVDTRLMEREDD